MLIHDKHWGVQPILFIYWASNALVSKLMAPGRCFFVVKIDIIETMQSSKTNFGNQGETIAANFLQRNGFKILALNYQNSSGHRLGEIDIIAKEKDELVFVEVKTRNWKNYADTLPEENITYSKLKKLSRIAENYLRQKNLLDCPYRFDALSVWIDPEFRQAKVKHLRNIYL
jgi:putative endonuclease